VLTVVTALVASFVVLDGVFGIVPRDEIGPVASITVFAVAVPLGFLGLHRPLRAGWLLLLVGAADKARWCSVARTARPTGWFAPPDAMSSAFAPPDPKPSCLSGRTSLAGDSTIRVDDARPW
jgi:hypothetical protein